MAAFCLFPGEGTSNVSMVKTGLVESCIVVDKRKGKKTQQINNIPPVCSGGTRACFTVITGNPSMFLKGGH